MPVGADVPVGANDAAVFIATADRLSALLRAAVAATAAGGIPLDCESRSCAEADSWLWLAAWLSSWLCGWPFDRFLSVVWFTNAVFACCFNRACSTELNAVEF